MDEAKAQVERKPQMTDAMDILEQQVGFLTEHCTRLGLLLQPVMREPEAEPCKAIDECDSSVALVCQVQMQYRKLMHLNDNLNDFCNRIEV